MILGNAFFGGFPGIKFHKAIANFELDVDNVS
jgi:hypothetical protein